MNNIVEKSHIIIIEAWNALTEFEYSSRRSAWKVIFRTSKGPTLIGDSIWMTTWKWPHHTHYLIEISLETSACFQVWHIKESRNENTESLPLDPKSKRGETGALFVCISFLYTGRIWGTTAHFLQDHWQTCINCAAEVQNQPPFLSQKFSVWSWLFWHPDARRNDTLPSLSSQTAPHNQLQLFDGSPLPGKWEQTQLGDNFSSSNDTFSIMIFQYTAK